jgi:hypothetical protein
MNELIDVTNEELKRVEGGFRFCWRQRICFFNRFLHRFVCFWVRRCGPPIVHL